MENKYGLTRNIPLPIKREVRQRCGYGCVLCGFMFYHYHHFDPEFFGAKVHRPEGITLLCAKHHDEVSRGRISDDLVRKADASPASVQEGHANYVFEDLRFPLEVALGGIVFISPEGELLKLDGSPEMLIKSEDGAPLLTASFCFDDEELVIKDNELVVSNGNWDVETQSNEIIVRRDAGEIVFHLVFDPPNRIQILRIKTIVNGHTIDSVFGKKLYIKAANGATIDFASGFIPIGGGLELSKEDGIIITGGSLMIGAEKENTFQGTTLDYLFSQVERLRKMSSTEGR